MRCRGDSRIAHGSFVNDPYKINTTIFVDSSKFCKTRQSERNARRHRLGPRRGGWIFAKQKDWGIVNKRLNNPSTTAYAVVPLPLHKGGFYNIGIASSKYTGYVKREFL